MSEAPESGAGLRAWIEIARLSNAPTVVSNVIAGSAIGAMSAGVAGGWGMSGGPVALLSVGAVLLYAGGMVLNDAMDAEVDRVERPTRPVPSGRIGRGTAFGAAGVMLAAGCGVVAMVGIAPLNAGLALVGAIVLYNLLHRRSAVSVLLMGLCRGLVYVMAMAAVVSMAGRPEMAVPGAVLAAYTAAFSLIARGEMSRPGAGVRLGSVMPAVLAGCVVIAAAGAGARTMVIAAVVAGLVLLPAARLWRPAPDTRRAVMAWIAGFCIIDAGVAAALGRWDLAAVCGVCFFATALLHRRILGT